MSTISPEYIPPEGSTCMEEVKEFIHMPTFDASKTQQPKNRNEIDIDHDVVKELGVYVSAISARYRKNPFHNVSSLVGLLFAVDDFS